jgi:hypothetical protein
MSDLGDFLTSKEIESTHLYALSAAASAISKKLSDISREPSIIERTLQLKPDFAEAHLFAGNILLRLNQLQRARIEYEEYLLPFRVHPLRSRICI